MHITRFIEPMNLPPLDFATIDFDERVNLFIGPNGSGKSTILRAIKVLHTLALEGPVPIFDENLDRSIYTDSDGASYIINTFGLSASDDWPRDESGGARWSEIPFLYIPATRVNLPGAPIYGQTIKKPEDLETEAPLKHLFDTESGIFDGRYVELAIDWLREGMVGDRDQQRQLDGALNFAYSCAQAICPEVLSEGGPRPYLDEDEISATPRRFVHFGMGIETSDNTNGERLYAGVLSSGTQGTLLWVYALALKILEHYGFDFFWEGKTAILLIDEIENHLHPTWQRRVIPALLDHFPGLQIFATTHSPFVVAGLKTGQVHLLKRDENGNVTATTNTEDVIGWTSDEILRNMMGVDDPTDNETAEAARELRQLRSEGPRSSPEEEQDRQERMQELRQRVDRDLLAGGPWKKQRELFEEQFAEALQKYRESKDMNQENG